MTWHMKRVSIPVAAIGVVCGAEVVVAVAIGGAGIGALVGREALLVAVVGVVLALGLVTARRLRAGEDIGVDVPIGPNPDQGVGVDQSPPVAAALVAEPLSDVPLVG